MERSFFTASKHRVTALGFTILCFGAAIAVVVQLSLKSEAEWNVMSNLALAEWIGYFAAFFGLGLGGAFYFIDALRYVVKLDDRHVISREGRKETTMAWGDIAIVEMKVQRHGLHNSGVSRWLELGENGDDSQRVRIRYEALSPEDRHELLVALKEQLGERLEADWDSFSDPPS